MIPISWRPNIRNTEYQPKPDFVPDWVYTEAMAAKYHYNVMWEYWVWLEAQRHNKSIAETEDACIRGIKKELLRMKFMYGDKIGKWYEEFLDMGDIFQKVKHPEYLPKLG